MGAETDQRSLLSRFLQGPAMLEQAVAGLRDVDLDAPPSQGGWTIALGNEEGEFTLEWYWRLPQDAWADRWCYAHRPLDVSLALFRATRAHIAQLLEHVPDGWSRSVSCSDAARNGTGVGPRRGRDAG
jgi:hypothetical protein